MDFLFRLPFRPRLTGLIRLVCPTRPHHRAHPAGRVGNVRSIDAGGAWTAAGTSGDIGPAPPSAVVRLWLVPTGHTGPDRAVQVDGQLRVHRADALDGVPDPGRHRLAGAFGRRRGERPGPAAGTGGPAQFGDQLGPFRGGPGVPGRIVTGRGIGQLLLEGSESTAVGGNGGAVEHRRGFGRGDVDRGTGQLDTRNKVGVTTTTPIGADKSIDVQVTGREGVPVMYKYGFDLPHFAMFPLLDDPRAVAELRGMYTRYLDTAARHGFGVLVGGFDYRASPDWGSLLGYSRESLAEMQLRAIDFLRELARPYEGQVPALLYAGIVGPRGDAYEMNRAITAEEAEEYHSEQLATLARAGVDLAEAMTFNSVPEVVGLARAAARAGVPLVGVVHAGSRHPPAGVGPTVKDAIETIDAQTGDDRPAFYGINCSHPLEFMPGDRAGRVVPARALPAAQRRDDGQDLALHARAPRGG